MLPQKPLTVVHLKVENFKRIIAADVTPPAHGLIEVRGKNAAGKSSLIESMIVGLLGRSAAPDLPITNGAHGSSILVDLGEIRIFRKWKRDSGGKAVMSLSVEAANGSEFKSPQAVLDNLVGHFCDPIGFLDLSPAEQVKAALIALKLDGEINRLEREEADLFSRRTELGRDATRSKKALEAAHSEYGFAAEPEEQGMDSAGLVNSLTSAQEHNEKLARMHSRIDAIKVNGKANSDRIEKLRAEIDEIEAQQSRLRDEYTSLSAALANSKLVDVAAIKAKLDDVGKRDTRNATIRAHREMLAKAKKQAETDAAAYDVVDEKLGTVRSKIAEALGRARFPVEGMVYDHESKLLKVNGIPLSQASQAERIKVATAIAMSGSPTFQVFFIREGSLLDKESKALIESIAEANDYQCWFEVVDSEKAGVGLYIEDGRVTGDGVASDAVGMVAQK